jgi:hypothetical protein
MMKRLLILHCGPMKTGSTVIQDALKFHRISLRELGISSYHILAKNLLSDLEKILLFEEETTNPVVLLSSEFFWREDPGLLRQALSNFSGETHAILVSRPFREVYPSLYLQNLKGGSKRITSFEYFLERQIAIDTLNLDDGQLMNAPSLDERLSAAGCRTHWIRYDRDSLLVDFFKAVQHITSISLTRFPEGSLEKPVGLSPRRSLRMEFAGLVRAINCLNRSKLLTDQLRKKLLIILLDISEYLNLFLGKKLPISRRQVARCDAVDRLVNQAFLKHHQIDISIIKQSHEDDR